jgi:hypothetical protein
MWIRKYLNLHLKRQINYFIFKNTFIYTIILILFIIFLFILKFTLKKAVLILLSFFLFIFFCSVIWAYINMYIYFKKKKGRSLLQVPWEKMESFEKEFYISMEKLIPLIFIYGFEGLLFLLIFIFLYR